MTNCYIFRIFMFLLGAALFSNASTTVLAASTQPTSWNASLPHHSIRPARLIAIDKNKQQLYILNGNKNSSGRLQFVCTTGQKIGNKQFQGDLKTPEGIYFIVQHLNSGLDFLLYGNEAYTLNYPNPADRYYKKTGYGIWIHGRGEAISPLITQGCIAMDNNDLAAIGSYLVPGTPVAVANSLIMQPINLQEDSATTKLLYKKVQDWTHAWSNRSPAFFTFYDEYAYSIAQQEDFSRFKAQKERLFKALPWIKTTAKDIQIIKGPTYWITWFYQDYEAPNLATQGIRRLYWHKNKKGEFVIMGMEWLPGLSSGSMIANAEPATPIDTSGISEEQVVPVAAAESIAVDQPKKLALHSETSSEDTLPRPELAIELYHSGKLPASYPTADASLDRSAPLTLAEALPPSIDSPQSVAFSERVETKNIVSELPNQAATPTAQLALQLPPPLPAQGLAGKNLLASETTLPAVIKSQTTPPVTSAVLPLPAHQLPGNQEKKEKIEEHAITLTQAETIPPIYTTNIKPEELPTIQAVEQAPSDILPVQPPSSTEEQHHEVANEPGKPAKLVSPVPPHDDTLVVELRNETNDAIDNSDTTETSVLTAVETWRQAWESGDLEFYMEFYTTDAKQGKRHGFAAIQKQKEQLWRQKAPAKIELSDISVTYKNDIAHVTMQQKYTDSTGAGDIGIKTLQLELVDGLWCISDEQWSVK